MRRYAGSGHLGVLLTPRAANSVEAIRNLGLPWAADNSAFSGFSKVRFANMLERDAVMMVRYGATTLRYRMKPAYIYGLTDPRTAVIHSVGKANDPTERSKAHLRPARTTKPDPAATAARRFWSKVKKLVDRCWLWTGCCNSQGYPQLRMGRRTADHAHRFSYRLHFGPFPARHAVRQSCGNKRCLNPDHLYLAPGRGRRSRHLLCE